MSADETGSISGSNIPPSVANSKPSPLPLAYARLLRLPNHLTAIADALMGWWIASGADPVALIGPLLTSECLYAAGMVSNDLFDMDEDRRDRPFRPLPSGAIRVADARFLLAILCAVGLISAALSGNRTFTIAATLLVVILSYNAVLKRTPIGPWAMGSCRTLNVLLGASTSLNFLRHGSVADLGPVGWLALAHGVFIAGVTSFARSETRQSNVRILIVASLIMLAGFALTSIVLWRQADGLSMGWVLLIAWGINLAHLIGRAIRDPQPAAVQRVIKWSILGLIVVDSAVVWVFVGPMAAATIGLLLVPSLILGRWVYST